MTNMLKRRSFITKFVATALIVALSSSAFASKTARVISAVSYINGAKWGIICAIDPEPASKTATGVIAGIYGLVGGGASLYDAIVDPPPQGPPSITAVYAGPAVDRNQTTGELLPPPGRPVKRAAAWRIVSIVGTNFSWTPSEMTVFFGGTKATLLGQSTNTLLMAVVPEFQAPAPVNTSISVTVNGVPSNAFGFTVDPRAAIIGNPAAIRDAQLAKERTHLQRIFGFDWRANALAENPGISNTDLAAAMNGANQMTGGASRVLQELPVAETGLTQQITLNAFVSFVQANPELEALTDQSNDTLR